MGPTLSRTCTGDQAAVLMRNAWRHALVCGVHVRIHPPNAYMTVHPPQPVRFISSVDVLASAIAPWGRAEAEAVAALEAIFGPTLRQGASTNQTPTAKCESDVPVAPKSRG